MRRPHPIVALALVVAGPLAAREGAPEGKAPPPVPRGQGAPPDGSWWTNPRLVEELSLSEEQREKMDAYVEAYQKSAPERKQQSAPSQR